ncbi:hypothetical protein HMI54_011672 [Coelomomyces lativittatus]|nr:hypothetical protein HMI54_011672 [Coelomomyces lativittatus]
MEWCTRLPSESLVLHTASLSNTLTNHGSRQREGGACGMHVLPLPAAEDAAHRPESLHPCSNKRGTEQPDTGNHKVYFSLLTVRIIPKCKFCRRDEMCAALVTGNAPSIITAIQNYLPDMFALAKAFENQPYLRLIEPLSALMKKSYQINLLAVKGFCWTSALGKSKKSAKKYHMCFDIQFEVIMTLTVRFQFSIL